jgi:ribonuclease HII
MIKISDKYPEYDFASNKGYGTLKHRDAIFKNGLTELHRSSFNLMPK